MNEKVSICIPAYNAEKYIHKCISKVLKQTYDNFEIVVVDDASTDRTAEIIHQFSDKRINYFRNEKNLGWRGNVKKCYQLALGDFVTILPIDDFLQEKFIETAINIFNKYNNIGIWACGRQTLNENFETIGFHRRLLLGEINAKSYFRFLFLLEDISAPPETMIRKKCFNQVNGYDCYSDEKYKQFPEIKLYMKIALAGFDTFHSEETLVERTSRNDSLTSKYGMKAFVLNDKYNVFYEYIDNAFLDDKIIEKANKKLAFNSIGYIKTNLKYLNLIEAIKSYYILYRRDYQCNKKGFFLKIFYINRFIIQYIRYRINRNK